jgi:hypothetical protein
MALLKTKYLPGYFLERRGMPQPKQQTNLFRCSSAGPGCEVHIHFAIREAVRILPLREPWMEMVSPVLKSSNSMYSAPS